MELIDGGAEEIEKDEDAWTVYSSFEDFGNMQKKFEEISIEPESQELQRIPKTNQTLDLETAQKVVLILEKFEENDDVNSVFHNLEITEELEELI